MDRPSPVHGERQDEEGHVRVGFIGLGNMGEGMATNLVSKGFEVTVRDVRPEPVERLAAAGAVPAATNYELAQRSDVVCIAVFDEKQVTETCEPNGEDQGLLAGLQPRSSVLLHATISPTFVRDLAASAVTRGITVMDVAMSGGGDVAAREGRLTFMCGGSQGDFARVRPVLEAMAIHIHHVGDLGAGVTAKIVNNMLAVSNVMLVREALRLCDGLGLDQSALLGVVNTAVGRSWVSENWEAIRAQEQGYTRPGGIVKMAEKDMHLALDLSKALSVPMPAVSFLVSDVMPEIDRRGLTA
jgi:3-hydroxyisobutyrate dehydrogenase-like beta-hydroxyacid dehydrogenase